MDPSIEFTFTLVQLVISAIALLVAVVSLGFAATKTWAEIHPTLENRRSKRILEDKFSRGPFDKATIEQATKYYLRPKCMNMDPTQERELRHALVATEEGLFEKVDDFLDHDTGERHLLILADSGMGKTSFVLNYYAHNGHRRRRKRHKLALVPLGDPNADQMIAEIRNQEETAIFLDALDEDVKAIEDHRARIRALLEACRAFKRVVVTCRTQFFPSDEEIPVETGIARIGPRKAGETGTFEFWKLYLAPFSDEDVTRYLKKRFPVWQRRLRKEATEIALKIPLLSARPMLLAHIPDVVASGERIRNTCELYEVMIQAWIVRESKWLDKAALREFSERLAVDMYVKRDARRMERVPEDQLSPLADKWGIRLEDWQIRGRSLLNRDAEGNYKFAHRSIMEYLFVVRLLEGDDVCYDLMLTDLMKRFLSEILGLRMQDSLLHRPGGSPSLPSWILGLPLRARGTGMQKTCPFSREEYPRVIDFLSRIADILTTSVSTAPISEDTFREIRNARDPRLRPRYPEVATPEQVAAMDEMYSMMDPAGIGLKGNRAWWYPYLGELDSRLIPLLVYCKRNGFDLWDRVRLLNLRPGIWLEPVSRDSDEFALMFTPTKADR